MILKILLAVFTGIGGHYLNKRWDKALLFFCLFLITSIIPSIIIYLYMMFIAIPGGDAIQAFDSISKYSRIIFISGMSFLWLTSIIVTIIDSKKSKHTISKWTISGILGSIFTTIITILFFIYSANTFYSIINTDKTSTDSVTNKENVTYYESNDFYENIFLGGVPSDSYNLPEPPSGNGVLKGRILYKQQPAKAISLSLILNSKYKTKNILTDSKGMFTVNLPPGEWNINSIQAERWEGKPEKGNFSMYYGGEEKLSEKGRYNPQNFDSQGFPVIIKANSEIIHIDLTINPDIKIIWPGSNNKQVETTINDSISWENNPEVHKYYLEINKLKRDGTTTHFELITTRILKEESSIPLSNLKYIYTGEKVKHEYSTEIYAFSKDGTLISKSSGIHQGNSFLLTDGNILVKDELKDIFDYSSSEETQENQKKMEAVFLNEKRISAVHTLIDDNLLTSAEKLLSLVNSSYTQGQKEVLTGYLLALQGKCMESGEMFKMALTINSKVCIPEKYKVNCK